METLSVCMMVQNRETLLPIALESLGEIYDELIVVDGGSRDRTCEVCAAYGARLIHSPWQDHHANQRNVYLAAAQTDWVFAIDSDEFIDQNTLYFLHLVKLRGQQFTPSLFFLPRRWISPHSLRHYITSAPHYPDGQARLFRPEGLSYKGRVHSIPTGAPRPTQMMSGLGLYHLDLWIHSEEQRRQKVEHYSIENPQDGAAEYYLPDVSALALAEWNPDDLLPSVQQQLRSLDPTLPAAVDRTAELVSQSAQPVLSAQNLWMLFPVWRELGEFEFFELVAAVKAIAQPTELPIHLLVCAGAASLREVQTVFTNAATALRVVHSFRLPDTLKVYVIRSLDADLNTQIRRARPTRIRLSREDQTAIALLDANLFPAQTLADLQSRSWNF